MKYNFKLDMKSDNSLSIILRRINPNSTVLEFGPANGRMTRYLHEILECKVYIVEIDKEAGINAAKYAYDYVFDDIENYKWVQKFKSVKFDYIVYADVLEHLYNPMKALNESKKLLKDDGIIYCSVPNISHNSILIDLLNDKFDYRPTGLLDETHIRFFTYKELLQLFKKAELNVNYVNNVNVSVEDTEFNNSYDEIPEKVRYIFKGRKYGEVYQYIFGLKKSTTKSKIQFKNLIHKYYVQLFVDTGLGYNSNEVLYEPIYFFNTLEHQFEFDISGYKDIKGFRLDPLNEKCSLIVENFIYSDQDGKLYNEKPYISNCKYKINNILVFNDNDPQIYFNVKSNSKILKKVIVKLKFIDVDYFDENKWPILEDERKIIEQKEDYIQKQREELENERKIIEQKEDYIQKQRKKLEDVQKIVEQKENQIRNLNEEISYIKSLRIFKLYDKIHKFIK